MEGRGLQGLRVLSFESRRATEMAELIRRHGGEAIEAPSMREVALEENDAAFELLRRLRAGSIDVVILLTGVGTRTLVAALAGECPRDELATLLGRPALVARGPKPVAALRELGLVPQLTAPEPNTWRELLAVIDTQLPLGGKRVALQEYGITNAELVQALESRAASVLRVPVYQWALPLDVGPLRAAVERWARREVDWVVFTSATQAHHVMQIADELHLREAIRAASPKVLVASIGPVCSETLRALGLPVDLEPEHPKMGHLLAALARQGVELIAARASSSS